MTTRKVRKTRKMLAIERKEGRPIEKLLPDLINEFGLSGAAQELRVSKATIGYWLLKLGIQSQRVLLSPGETLEIRRRQV